MSRVKNRKENSMISARLWWVGALSGCLFVAGCGCGAKNSAVTQQDGGADGQADAATDAKVDGDAVPVEDGAIQHDFCDQGFFKLPIDGPTQENWGIDIGGDKVVYSITEPNGDPKVRDIHLLNLSNCTEEYLTKNGRTAGPKIENGRVVWADFRDTSASDPYYCNDFYMYDLSTKTETQLTNDNLCQGSIAMHGDWFAYTLAEQAIPNHRSDLRLTRFGESEVDVVLPGVWLPVEPHLSESYLVFAAQSEDSTSMGRDIYYYDLLGKSLHHVWESSDVWCDYCAHWGDWIIYDGPYQALQPPYKVGIYNISTKQHKVLSADEGVDSTTAIYGNLAVWTTASYSGAWNQGKVDVMVYDTNSEITRRITKESSMLRGLVLEFPYMLMIDVKGYTGDNMRNDYYVANLIKLGIADAEGNLLSGEGVIEPPN